MSGRAPGLPVCSGLILSKFSLMGIFAFLQGVLEKRVAERGVFCGEVVVGSVVCVVSWMVLFRREELSMDSGFIFGDFHFGNGLETV